MTPTELEDNLRPITLEAFDDSRILVSDGPKYGDTADLNADSAFAHLNARPGMHCYSIRVVKPSDPWVHVARCAICGSACDSGISRLPLTEGVFKCPRCSGLGLDIGGE